MLEFGLAAFRAAIPRGRRRETAARRLHKTPLVRADQNDQNSSTDTSKTLGKRSQTENRRRTKAVELVLSVHEPALGGLDVWLFARWLRDE